MHFCLLWTDQVPLSKLLYEEIVESWFLRDRNNDNMTIVGYIIGDKTKIERDRDREREREKKILHELIKESSSF